MGQARHPDEEPKAGMKLPDILAYTRADRTTALAASGFLIATIAFAHVLFQPSISWGVLYLLPIMIASLYLSRKGVLALAVLCTILREVFGPLGWAQGGSTRATIGLVAYFGTGLFVTELTRRRRQQIRHLRELEEQSRLRAAAEQQLRVLVETSPAAILTVDSEGKIRLANQAAHQLLGCEGQPLVGEPVGNYLPALAGVPQPDSAGRIFRTTMECRGRRRSGEVFLAQVWLSTFSTPSGPILASIVLDASSDLRDREEVGLQRLMMSSRVLVRAVSHEIRNLCAAIAVVHANLRRIPAITGTEDYAALGTLVEGLGRLVSAELRPSSEGRLSEVDLHDVLDELRIIIEPSFRDDEIQLQWRIPEDLPPVLADRHGLLHVFMNLASNSQRAMRQSAQKELSISAAVEDGRVLVRFSDTGHGVERPDELFQAFQHSADGAGLGLYLSRALVRAFAGELRHEPQAYGCCFTVDLALARPVGASVL